MRPMDCSAFHPLSLTKDINLIVLLEKSAAEKIRSRPFKQLGIGEKGAAACIAGRYPKYNPDIHSTICNDNGLRGNTGS